jgi:NAD+ diphosphatase
MDSRFISSSHAPPDTRKLGWWFLFRDHRMMVIERNGAVSVPAAIDGAELGIGVSSSRYMGTLGGLPCWCGRADGDETPEGMAFKGLRYLYGRLDETIHGVALRAAHLVEWERNERYCGRCGAETEPKTDEVARQCTKCGRVSFPRISPAVIVLVEKEGKVLLARASRFAEELYSVLAGFVEPGESLEETVQREIEEEVGIKVTNIRYFGSQPWPFPDSLMIAFTAEYAGGEIKIDGVEIEEAAWFEADSLPRIPGRISVARKLIDWFVEARVKDGTAVGIKNEKTYHPGE